MKELFTPKSLSILAAIAVVIGLVVGQTREETVMIGGLIAAAWLAITLHELGHVMMGKLAGFEFITFITGPVQVEKTEKGIVLKENRNWASIGGLAYMIPPLVKKDEMIHKQILYSAGGPVFSLFFALAGLILYYQVHHDFLMFFSLMNAGIFVATMIPSGKGGSGSDGYFIITCLRKNEKSLKLVEDLLIYRELLSYKKPGKWNQEYIQWAKQKTPSLDHVMDAMMVYYYEIEHRGFQAAQKQLDGFAAIPITKQNSRHLSAFTHMKQLAYFLLDNQSHSLEKIHHLQQFLSPIEPVSYYRGEAILAYLRNNRTQALVHLEKVKKMIEKNEQRYGFFQAEKTLTNMVEEKMGVTKGTML